MHSRTLSIFAGVALALNATVRAGLDVSLAPSIRNAARGVELVFTGSLTNNSATEKLFLNDISAVLGGSAAVNLSLESNAFYSNVPGILLPGESYTGVLFRIALNGAAPAGDYPGTIEFSGGAGILAATTLSSSAFTVLSPEVSIVATDAEAGEFGPDTGTFTVSRTGGTDISLPVSWAIGGTTGKGAFQAVPAGLTIPAGASSATVTITPIPNDTAEGDRTVAFSLQPSAVHNTTAPLTGTVTIHDKPADAWRLLHFGAAANDPAAADAADWDFDGFSNLLEYSLATDPAAPFGDSPLLAPAAGELIVAYVPNPAATDVQYFVEASSDLVSWSSNQVEAIAPPSGSAPGTLAFRAVATPGLGLASRLYLRLRAQR